MESLNVLYTVNRKFKDIMLASIISLIENSGIAKINLHIITADFSDEDYKRIEAILDNYSSVDYDFYPLEDFNINRFGIPDWRGTQIANARLFFQDILGKKIADIDKLLYLDSDTIVVDDLNDLANYNDSSLAAVKDLVKKRAIEYLGVPVYYNSGVLYVNVDSWIKNSFQDMLLESIEGIRDDLSFPDQDILNLALAREIDSLPAMYNVGPIEFAFSDIFNNIYFNTKIRQVGVEEIKMAHEHPKILHAYGYGNIKPWTNNSINPFNEKFMEYLLKANPEFQREEVTGINKLFAFNSLLAKSALFAKSFIPSKSQKRLVKENLKI